MAGKVTVLLNYVRDIAFDVTDKNGKTIRQVIKGTGSLVKDAEGKVIKGSALPMVGAYGITTGVDSEVWEEIKKQYGSMSIFTKGYIKASTPKTEEAVKAEVGGKANGEEPIKPRKSKKSKE